MTGDLLLKSDNRLHFAIMNADGTARAYIYKDKGSDGVVLNNGVDGGGTFIFGKNGEFYSPSHVHVGNALLNVNGDIYGLTWGNQNISTWLNSQFAARDNNINVRATIDWVNQNFVRDVRMGTNLSATWGANGGTCPPGYVLTGGDFNDNVEYPIYAPVQKNVNGIWYNVERQ